MTSTIAIDTRTGAPSWPLSWTSGLPAVFGVLSARLRTEIGEWPGDVSIGLPLAEWAQSPRPDPERAAALVRIQCEAVPGVEVTSCVVTVGQAVTITVVFDWTDPDTGATESGTMAGIFGAVGLPAWSLTLGVGC